MLSNFWKNNKGFIGFIFLMLFFRTALADWYNVPTGSMQPNILIGDRVFVNKLAYDVKIPFTDINLNRHAEPEFGDVIVFESRQADERLIKRVIGLPGDRVEMVDNHLKINGKWVQVAPMQLGQEFDQFMKDRELADYFIEKPTAQERVSGAADLTRSYPIRTRADRMNPLSSFAEVKVPAEHFLVLGDNRDNSADSRVIGMVPRNELVGRAERIVISFDSDNYYLPRDGRYWELL